MPRGEYSRTPGRGRPGSDVDFRYWNVRAFVDGWYQWILFDAEFLNKFFFWLVLFPAILHDSANSVGHPFESQQSIWDNEVIVKIKKKREREHATRLNHLLCNDPRNALSQQQQGRYPPQEQPSNYMPPANVRVVMSFLSSIFFFENQFQTTRCTFVSFLFIFRIHICLPVRQCLVKTLAVGAILKRGNLHPCIISLMLISRQALMFVRKHRCRINHHNIRKIGHLYHMSNMRSRSRMEQALYLIDLRYYLTMLHENHW